MTLSDLKLFKVLKFAGSICALSRLMLTRLSVGEVSSVGVLEATFSDPEAMLNFLSLVKFTREAEEQTTVRIAAGT